MKSMGKYLETPHHNFWKSNRPSAEPPPTSGETNGDPDRNPSPSSENHGGNEAHANGIQEGDYDGEETVDSEASIRSCTQCSELTLEKR